MKWLVVSVVALGMAGAGYVSRAADQGSRPPGVAAGDWFRIGERFGFVVVRRDGGVMSGGAGGAQVLQAAPENLPADMLAPLKGYFVIQTPTGWRSVVMSEPVEFTR
jgi:hypothetical protein